MVDLTDMNTFNQRVAWVAAESFVHSVTLHVKPLTACIYIHKTICAPVVSHQNHGEGLADAKSTGHFASVRGFIKNRSPIASKRTGLRPKLG